jgi:ParB family transcriptional regulator, chromosome partitioning protein
MARRALGKGLSALLGDAAAPQAQPAPTASASAAAPQALMLGDREAVLLDCDRIQANPNQPRKHMNANALEELAASIRQNGVLQPILVRKISGGFELVAGERRLRATRMAGLTQIPTLVCTMEEAESLKLALLENIQRENLNAIEEAQAYRAIMETYGATHQEVADMLGKKRSTVTNMLRLLSLESSLQMMLGEGALSMGHARALLAVEDSTTRLRVARQIVRHGLSVREVEKRVGANGAKKKASTKSGGEGPTKRDPDAAALREFEDRLREHLGSPVQIRRSGKKGRIEVLFYSDEELERILESMGISSQL